MILVSIINQWCETCSLLVWPIIPWGSGEYRRCHDRQSLCGLTPEDQPKTLSAKQREAMGTIGTIFGCGPARESNPQPLTLSVVFYPSCSLISNECQSDNNLWPLCCQAGEVVARWAEATRPGRSVPHQSLLEVLPNPHAGGHLLPPSYNGGWIRWTSECPPRTPIHPDSSAAVPPPPCWLISFSLSCGLGSPKSACYFIPFHAGLRNWKPPPCCEIMTLLTVRPILMS